MKDFLLRRGFSLIELLVVIAIIAFMAAIVVPNLKPRQAGAERKQTLARLNALMQLARSNALMTTKIYKILFDLEKKTVELQVQTDKKDSSGEPVYQQAKGGYLTTLFSWPKHLEIKNFYVEGFDEMEKLGGQTTKQIWFFIAASGVAQMVTINFLDTRDRSNNKPRQIGLVLNPFSAQFKEYDSFQK